MDTARLVLDYFRVVLSWPVMVLALGIFFFVRFRSSIDLFLTHIGTIKLPGGAEITAKQPTPEAEVGAAAETDVDDLPEAQRQLVDALLQELESHKEQAASNQEVWEEANRQLQWAAVYWEFMYLSKYLVFKTRFVLRRLREFDPPLTRDAYNERWPQWAFGEVAEREAVYAALTTTGLVKEENSVLQVTDKGEAFVQFLSQFKLG